VERDIIIFFLVHFLIDDILLGDTERAAGAALVDFWSPPSWFYSSFETSVTAPWCSNVCSIE
jgi:hypothetical protein